VAEKLVEEDRPEKKRRFPRRRPESKKGGENKRQGTDFFPLLGSQACQGKKKEKNQPPHVRRPKERKIDGYLLTQKKKE